MLRSQRSERGLCPVGVQVRKSAGRSEPLAVDAASDLDGIRRPAGYTASACEQLVKGVSFRRSKNATAIRGRAQLGVQSAVRPTTSQ